MEGERDVKYTLGHFLILTQQHCKRLKFLPARGHESLDMRRELPLLVLNLAHSIASDLCSVWDKFLPVYLGTRATTQDVLLRPFLLVCPHKRLPGLKARTLCRAYDRAAYILRPDTELNFPETDYSKDDFILVGFIKQTCFGAYQPSGFARRGSSQSLTTNPELESHFRVTDDNGGDLYQQQSDCTVPIQTLYPMSATCFVAS